MREKITDPTEKTGKVSNFLSKEIPTRRNITKGTAIRNPN